MMFLDGLHIFQCDQQMQSLNSWDGHQRQVMADMAWRSFKERHACCVFVYAETQELLYI